MGNEMKIRGKTSGKLIFEIEFENRGREIRKTPFFLGGSTKRPRTKHLSLPKHLSGQTQRQSICL